MERWLYVMVSRTDTRMGRMIRCFTRSEYNHVSLALEPEHFVSFARYRSDVPLAGGYVRETPERLLFRGRSVPVRIFRLGIREEEAGKLEALFRLAGDRDCPLIYNSLGALFTSCHIPCPIPGAYTCLDFAGAVLGHSFSSIRALAEALSPWEIYCGDLSGFLHDNGSRSDPFFRNRGFFKGTGDTAVHFNRLFLRLIRIHRPADPLAACQFDLLQNQNAVSG